MKKTSSRNETMNAEMNSRGDNGNIVDLASSTVDGKTVAEDIFLSLSQMMKKMAACLPASIQ